MKLVRILLLLTALAAGLLLPALTATADTGTSTTAPALDPTTPDDPGFGT